MKILITGIAGFLGSHLAKDLIRKNVQIIGVDNFSTGKIDNIKSLLDDDSFTLIRADISNTDELIRKLFYYQPFDYIFNLACPASPPAYQADPIQTTLTSVIGTKNLLDLAVKSNCEFFQASTSEVYGDPEINIQNENYKGCVNPIGPRSCYDEGKRCAESLCFDYSRVYNLPIKVVRIFNTYGPNMDPYDGRVVSNFIRQALKNEDITVYGDGSQTRSFCYVSDLINGIVKLARAKNITTPVNLGNDETEYTILNIAEKILNFIPDSSSKIVFKPLPIDDPKQRRPDLTLAKNLLSYTPTVSIDEGLLRTIRWFLKDAQT